MDNTDSKHPPNWYRTISSNLCGRQAGRQAGRRAGVRAGRQAGARWRERAEWQT